MMLDDYPEKLGELRRLYWFLRESKRLSRPKVSTRTWYRRIRVVRSELLALGVSPFELHSFCRSLAAPRRFF